MTPPRPAPSSSPPPEAVAPADPASPRTAALAAAAETPFSAPASVVYEACGAVLVAGEADRALPICAALAAAPDLRVVAVVTDETAAAKPPRADIVPGRVARIAGWLGAFRAEAAAAGNATTDLGPLAAKRDGTFDVVVDLGTPSLIDAEVPPLGYLAPRPDEPIESVVDDVRALAHGAEKPRWFELAPERCVHGARGVAGCTRCLDACPAGAIASAGDTVRIEPFLCRGCATCTLVCPTGAVSFAAPRPRALRARIARMIDAFRTAGGDAPRILLHAQEDDDRVLRACASDPVLVPVGLPSLGAAGPDAWLDALADGAAGVLVLESRDLPPTARRVLARELELARTLLEGLGHPPDRLRLIGASDLAALPPAPRVEAVAKPERDDRADDKRSVVERTLARLAGTGTPPASASRLPEGASLGRVVVDAHACTVCLACTRLCPTGALHAGRDGPALRFVEADCVQCGLCANGCPEQAVHLEPRLLADLRVRGEATTLARSEMASCERCGTPFLPRALLDASLARLGGSEAADETVLGALRACPACRSEATMAAQFGARRSTER